METIKKEKKAEGKQQYQKRKGYFKEYYQKHKDVMDANNKKNAKKYREEYKQLKEENKNLKEEVKRLEFDVDAWHQLKLLLEGEIEKLEKERDEYKEKLNKAGLEEYGFFNEH